jgi:precorrin-2 dehydrogenase/sirohydrochlorin ferrochelatase
MLLPFSFDLDGREILLVGGGKAALEKYAQLRRTACRLTIVAREFKPEFLEALKSATPAVVTVIERPFTPQDIAGKFMVFSAVDDEAVAEQIFRLCRQEKILINSADDRTRCDFFTNALIERGPVTLSVSTQGRFAGFSAILRRHLEELLPPEIDEDWERVFDLRKRAIALQSVSEKKSVITNIVRDIEQKFFRATKDQKDEQADR